MNNTATILDQISTTYDPSENEFADSHWSSYSVAEQ